MSRFIVVIHGWHVSSNGFNVHQIYAETMHEANEKAAYLTMKRQDTFDNCAYTIIEIGAQEEIKHPRKLTINERLTGWVKP